MKKNAECTYENLNEKLIFCKENNLFFAYVMSQSKTSLLILTSHIENFPNYF